MKKTIVLGLLLMILLSSIVSATTLIGEYEDRIVITDDTPTALAAVYPSNVATCGKQENTCYETPALGKRKLENCRVISANGKDMCTCDIGSYCDNPEKAVCTDGAVRCNSVTARQICVNGQWITRTNCAKDEACVKKSSTTLYCEKQDSKAVLGKECTPGEQKCNNNAPQVCASDGHWQYTGVKCDETKGSVCSINGVNGKNTASCQYVTSNANAISECKNNPDCNGLNPFNNDFQCIIGSKDLVGTCVDCSANGQCSTTCSTDPDCAPGQNTGVEESCLTDTKCLQNLNNDIKSGLSSIGIIKDDRIVNIDPSDATYNPDITQISNDAKTGGGEIVADPGMSNTSNISLLLQIIGIIIILVGGYLFFFKGLRNIGIFGGIIGIALFIGGTLL